MCAEKIKKLKELGINVAKDKSLSYEQQKKLLKEYRLDIAYLESNADTSPESLNRQIMVINKKIEILLQPKRVACWLKVMSYDTIAALQKSGKTSLEFYKSKIGIPHYKKQIQTLVTLLEL